ncbi:unnamed protein product [Echinostoma caproni]|uniref:Pre-mRNA-splicing factor SYF2 n=1 Tax=Echinostoma caproni TaxID=27848 RepID=A0A183B8L9_9TREM|nr:unnamed protein product [Echinostoma caproni]
MCELRLQVDQHRPLLVGITETWVHSGISDAELEIPELDILRQDRTDGIALGKEKKRVEPIPMDYDAYFELRKKCKLQRKQDTSEHQRQFLNRAIADPRSFYKNIYMVTQAKPGITDIRRADGSLTDGNQAAANTLGEYYSTVFSP